MDEHTNDVNKEEGNVEATPEVEATEGATEEAKPDTEESSAE